MKNILPGLALIFSLLLNLQGIYQPGGWLAWAFSGSAIFAAGLHSWRLMHVSFLFLLLSLARFLAPSVVYHFPSLLFWYILFMATLPMLFFHRARKALDWLKFGKTDRTSIALIATTSLLASAALLIWAHGSDNLGLAEEMVRGLRHYPKWLLFTFGIPLFALLNALVEELIYRGLLQAALQDIFRSRILVIFLQATAFAAAHFASGFPNGIVGYLMVLVYGIMLGYLRARSGGLLVPVLTHILADLTIFYFMVIPSVGNLIRICTNMLF